MKRKVNIKGWILGIVLSIAPLVTGVSSADLQPKDTFIHSVAVAKPVPFDSTSLGSLSVAEYKDRIAAKETMNHKDPYSALNKQGYMGKYQFGKRTLRGLGFTPQEIGQFLGDSTIQELAMNRLILHNIEVLKNYGAYRYIGRTVGGVKITQEGLLAAAHLVGPYAVKHYLITGGSLAPVTLSSGVTVRKIDANGTTIKDYLRIV